MAQPAHPVWIACPFKGNITGQLYEGGQSFDKGRAYVQFNSYDPGRSIRIAIKIFSEAPKKPHTGLFTTADIGFEQCKDWTNVSTHDITRFSDELKDVIFKTATGITSRWLKRIHEEDKPETNWDF